MSHTPLMREAFDELRVECLELASTLYLLSNSDTQLHVLHVEAAFGLCARIAARIAERLETFAPDEDTSEEGETP
jgi:hypothetical protein